MNPVARTLIRSGALGRAVAKKTREVGLFGTFKHATAKLIEEVCGGSPGVSPLDDFDAQYGTDTAKTVGVWALDIPRDKAEHANRYETVSAEVFLSNLRLLPVVHENFVFVDLGSGKGRALLLASRFPFKEIIGVEFSRELSDIANRNIQIYKDKLQRCRRITSLCEDATDYQLPDENLVLYLYNPFDAHLMQAIVSKVEHFIQQSPRQVFVVYQNPLQKGVWDRSRMLKLIMTEDRCVAYASGN